MKYTVILLSAHPDDEKAECWEDKDFETLEEAIEAFDNPWKFFDQDYYDSSTAYIELDSVEEYRVKRNPGFDPKVFSNEDWINEVAMQDRMMGCWY